MKKRFLNLLAFCMIWICADAWLNNTFLHLPGFGAKCSIYIDWLHYPFYGILGAYSAFTRSNFWTSSFLTWAVVDEVTQIWIPNRVADPLDIMRNIIGFWTGYFIIYIIQELLWKGRQSITKR